MSKTAISIDIDTQLHGERLQVVTNAINTLEKQSYQADHIIDTSDTTSPSNTCAVNNPTFFDQLYNVLANFEGIKGFSYKDSLGFRTIGIGFNMDQFYTKDDDTETKKLTRRQEKLYPILNAIGVPQGQEENVYSGKKDIDIPQIKSLFRVTITGRLEDGTKVISDSHGLRLQNKLKSNFGDNYVFSGNELVALQSLSFINSGLIGGNLIQAIKDNNLQKIKYEIVENSNKHTDENNKLIIGVHGIAGRRLAEGALFLGDAQLRLPDSEFWDTTAWARQIIYTQGESPRDGDTIATNSDLIINVKGPNPSLVVSKNKPSNLGNPQNNRDWTAWDAWAQGNIQTTIINNDPNVRGKYVMGGLSGSVLTFSSQKRDIHPHQRIDLNKRADIDEISQLDNVIFSGDPSDELIGDSTQTTYFYANDGDDTTRGGTGNDHHIPSFGNDLMQDSGGYDKYYIGLEDGHDIIDDSDRQGEIWYNGARISGTAKMDNTNQGQWTLDRFDVFFAMTKQNSDLVITMDETANNPSNSITIKNFDFINGQMGIRTPVNNLFPVECSTDIRTKALEVARTYLYGTNTLPYDMSDETLIRPYPSDSSVCVDLPRFMSEGAGRFALGSQFDVVRRFLIPDPSNWGYNISPGTYTTAEMVQKFHLPNYRVNLELDQKEYPGNDYIERVFIYNTGKFKVSDSARFIVANNASLTRYIENFAIEPDPNFAENVDLVWGGGTDIFNQHILKPTLDPSRLGRKVWINFSGTPIRSTYTWTSYQNDLQTMQQWNRTADISEQSQALLTNGPSLLNDFWEKGVTQFLYGDMPVIYGTEYSDVLSRENLTGVFSSFLPYASKYHTLWDYKDNGLVLIGGKGNDLLRTDKAPSILNGGTGFDTYMVPSNYQGTIKIKDSDGLGKIVKQDNLHHNSVLQGTANKRTDTHGVVLQNEYVLEHNTHTYKVSRNSDMRIEDSNGSLLKIEGVGNCRGQLGIRLSEDGEQMVSGLSEEGNGELSLPYHNTVRLTDGSIVTMWSDGGKFLRKMDSNGFPIGEPVPLATGYGLFALSNGNFVVYDEPERNVLSCQLFNGQGKALNTPQLVNMPQYNGGVVSFITPSPDGGFTLIGRTDSEVNGLYHVAVEGQHFDASGMASGERIRYVEFSDTEQVSIETTPAVQLSGNRTALIWEVYQARTGKITMHTQLLDSFSGQPLAEPKPVNSSLRVPGYIWQLAPTEEGFAVSMFDYFSKKSFLGTFDNNGTLLNETQIIIPLKSKISDIHSLPGNQVLIGYNDPSTSTYWGAVVNGTGGFTKAPFQFNTPQGEQVQGQIVPPHDGKTVLLWTNNCPNSPIMSKTFVVETGQTLPISPNVLGTNENEQFSIVVENTRLDARGGNDGVDILSKNSRVMLGLGNDVATLHQPVKRLGKQETTPVTNTIVDFKPGEDRIDVSEYGGFNAITLTPQGNNTVVELGGGDRLILEDVTPEQLRAEDFGGVSPGTGTLQPTLQEQTTINPTTVTPSTNTPSTEQPSTVIPTTNVPSTEIPTTTNPTTIIPTTNIPTTLQPTTETPSTPESTTDIPTTLQPTAEQVTTTPLTTNSPETTLESTTNIPTTEQPTTLQPTLLSSTMQEVTTEQPTTVIPTTNVPTTETLTTTHPTTEVPSTNTPTTELPTMTEETTLIPSTENQTTQQLTTETPSTPEVTSDIPTTLQPSTEQLSTEQSSTLLESTTISTTLQPTTIETTDIPSTTQETTGQESTLVPSSETLTTEQPSTEQPSTLQESTIIPTTLQPTIEDTTNVPSTNQETTQLESSLVPSSGSPTTDTPTTLQPSTEQVTTTQLTTNSPETTLESTTTIPTTEQPTTLQSTPMQEVTTEQPSTEQLSTEQSSTLLESTTISTTLQPTTIETTDIPSTNQETTGQSSTLLESTVIPTTLNPTTMDTTDVPSTTQDSTLVATSDNPTTDIPSTVQGVTTEQPSTGQSTTEQSSTLQESTSIPTTLNPTTIETTDIPSTTQDTTQLESSLVPSSETPTTNIPSTPEVTTDIPTTLQPTTEQVTTTPLTTNPPETTLEPTTIPTTLQPTMVDTTDVSSTTQETTQLESSLVPSSETPTTDLPSTQLPTESVTTTQTMQESSTQTPVTVSPTMETSTQGTTVEPTTEQPSTEQSTTEQPSTVLESTTDIPSTVLESTPIPTTLQPTTVDTTDVSSTTQDTTGQGSTLVPSSETPTTELPSTQLPTEFTTVQTMQESSTQTPVTVSSTIETSTQGTTVEPTTEQPSTEQSTTEQPSTVLESTTDIPSTVLESTPIPTTVQPTTVDTTDVPSTNQETTGLESTLVPSSETPTTNVPEGTLASTTDTPTTDNPTTLVPDTENQTTQQLTTDTPSTPEQTTDIPSTVLESTPIPTTLNPTTLDTEVPSTNQETTGLESTLVPTTDTPTTLVPSTENQTTQQLTTDTPSTPEQTTDIPSTVLESTRIPTTPNPTPVNTTDVPSTNQGTTQLGKTTIIPTTPPTTIGDTVPPTKQEIVTPTPTPVQSLPSPTPTSTPKPTTSSGSMQEPFYMPLMRSMQGGIKGLFAPKEGYGNETNNINPLLTEQPLAPENSLVPYTHPHTSSSENGFLVNTSTPEQPCYFKDGTTNIRFDSGNLPEDMLIGECQLEKPDPSTPSYGNLLSHSFTSGMMLSLLPKLVKDTMVSKGYSNWWSGAASNSVYYGLLACQTTSLVPLGVSTVVSNALRYMGVSQETTNTITNTVSIAVGIAQNTSNPLSFVASLGGSYAGSYVGSYVEKEFAKKYLNGVEEKKEMCL